MLKHQQIREILSSSSGGTGSQLGDSFEQTSIVLATALKKYGWKFVGPVICYAFMQACGMINDHEKTCWKAAKIGIKSVARD